MRKSLLLVMLMWCGTLAAQEEALTIAAPVEMDRSKDRGTARAVAPVTINGVSLPAYAIEVADALTEEAGGRISFDAQNVSEPLRSSASAAELRQLAVYYHAHGWLLVPRDWQLARARLGANGSEVVEFLPRNGHGLLSYVNTSACVGCAQSEAAPFFAEARRDAESNDFLFYRGTDVPVKTVRLRPNLVAFSAEKNGQRVDGVVFYDNSEDIGHWRVEVSLPAAQQSLARPILNRFVPPRSAK